ncbi:HNH endonuclease signature motif containing protein [Saccharothrix sp. NPDC042600]|uniref:HNH endonuclease n=1 Tax=Saccharothrix TaxID=2071 RepID=UPI0033E18D44|nr:hypothetical protein GCM10017745_11850 [Saccharothrix mutabilis subsp. capreolus]
MQAWSFLSVGDDRHFQGNSGYPDVLESLYVFDSTVQNARKVDEGDLVVVRNREVALGVARIERIVPQQGEKVRYLCPGCGRTAFKPRKHRQTRYLCTAKDCRREFDVPDHKSIPITRYSAHYGGTWRALDGALTVKRLRDEAAADNAKQNSISPLKLSAIEQLLSDLLVPMPPVPEPAGEPAADPAEPSELPGGHRDAMVRVRQGQAQFRKELLQRDGLRCAITGPCPAEALQAAHLRAFADHGKHKLAEGLLLRADVHVLFDRGLMAVHPTQREVHIAPALRDYAAYGALEGVRVDLSLIDVGAVRAHYNAAAATWGR